MISLNRKSTSIEEDSPSIRFSFQLVTSGNIKPHYILIAQFSGKYGVGSLGNPDTDFMVALLEASLIAWQPKKVIIDLSKLGYYWGNGMLTIVERPYHWTSEFQLPTGKLRFIYWRDDITNANTAIVVGPDNRKALSSLLFGMKTEKDITESPRYFNSVHEAFTYLQSIDRSL